MNVAVVGASDNPERTSYQAVERLKAKKHTVYPIHPKLQSLHGLPVYASLEAVPGPVDTVTLYVGAAISAGLEGVIKAAKPRRVIFNPGAENPELKMRLDAAGIQTLEACTLVLLSTNRF